jgi:hypothetical protein
VKLSLRDISTLLSDMPCDLWMVIALIQWAEKAEVDDEGGKRCDMQCCTKKRSYARVCMRVCTVSVCVCVRARVCVCVCVYVRVRVC